jgi:hypothetical protein
VVERSCTRQLRPGQRDCCDSVTHSPARHPNELEMRLLMSARSTSTPPGTTNPRVSCASGTVKCCFEHEADSSRRDSAGEHDWGGVMNRPIERCAGPGGHNGQAHRLVRLRRAAAASSSSGPSIWKNVRAHDRRQRFGRDLPVPRASRGPSIVRPAAADPGAPRPHARSRGPHSGDAPAPEACARGYCGRVTSIIVVTDAAPPSKRKVYLPTPG